MNALEQLLQDDLNRLIDRMAAQTHEGLVAGCEQRRPDVLLQLADSEERLTAARRRALEAYAVWRNALEECADLFALADLVDVVGVSKGRGFAGVVKRHHFRGGDATHGSMFHRAPGSIGASSDPSRVWPGHRLPGRMGGERHTVLNLEVMRVLPEQNLLVVRGAVPGHIESVVVVRKSVKQTKAQQRARKVQ